MNAPTAQQAASQEQSPAPMPTESTLTEPTLIESTLVSRATTIVTPRRRGYDWT